MYKDGLAKSGSGWALFVWSEIHKQKSISMVLPPYAGRSGSAVEQRSKHAWCAHLNMLHCLGWSASCKD
jgi:hypothetical protein